MRPVMITPKKYRVFQDFFQFTEIRPLSRTLYYSKSLSICQAFEDILFVLFVFYTKEGFSKNGNARDCGFTRNPALILNFFIRFFLCVFYLRI